MFQQRMSSLAFRPDDAHPDPAHALDQHLLAGFTPDLALDLVFNDLVMRAAEATRASAAALALFRGGEMVCRAATGYMAPGLGIPLNLREGLSGVCLYTRQAQLSLDTERDPRVDPSISRRLGIRSILIVPVFDINDNDANGNDVNDHDTDRHNTNGHDANDAIVNRAPFAGVLEVFSSSAAAFSASDQKVLEGFAEECSRIRHTTLKLSQGTPVAEVPTEFILPKLVASDFTALDSAPPDSTASDFTATGPSPALRLVYQTWTIALGALTVLATIAVTLLIGSRIGWLRPIAHRAPTTQVISAEVSAPQGSCVGTAAPGCPAEQSSAATTAGDRQAGQSSVDRSPEYQSSGNVSARQQEKRVREKAERKAPETSVSKSSSSLAPPAEGDLVVYEKGKVIFRLKPAPPKADVATGNQTNATRDPVVVAKSATKLAPAAATNDSASKVANPKMSATLSVWLSPDQAEQLLQIRSEPQYPAEALAAHRAGNVVLEVEVAADGSVSNIRTLSGDPVLAAASATAVRNWRYQPYRLHDHPSQFHTDVTLTFSLPH